MIEFKENTAYHCETKEEAKWLLNEAHKLGYKWGSDKSFIGNNRWHIHKGDMCYYIKAGSYSPEYYYKRNNYTIIKVKDLMQKNMTPKELQITAPEGWEIDREKSTLDKIIFKEVKQKYPMEVVPESMVLSIAYKLNLFGRLVLTCREWNRIDGWENKPTNSERAAIQYKRNKEIIVDSDCGWTSNTVIAFKDHQAAELFLSTFNKELQEVKEFL